MMPFLNRLPDFGERLTVDDLVEKRRKLLRVARSLTPGTHRNQLRQISLSLKSLLKNKAWCRAHVCPLAQVQPHSNNVAT
jgi:hypothetical protein